MRKKLLIEGWRYINHSYALVNQFQIKELLKNKNLDISFFDTPYFKKEWNKEDNHSGFNNSDFLDNLKKPSKNLSYDLIYRISYPLNLDNGNANQIFIYGTSEFQNLDGILDKKTITNYKKNKKKIKFITPSNWSKKGFLSFGFPENDIFVIPNGVDQKVFQPISKIKKEELRKKFNFSNHNFVFLNLGAMTWNKGIDILLSAFSIINKKFPHTKLILKDQSNLYNLSVKNLIQTFIKKNPSTNRKMFANIIMLSKNLSLNDLNLLYGLSDAYVAPYRAEGFNLPPLEAAASGLPVILTSKGSTDDYYRNTFAIQIDSKLMQNKNNTYLEPKIESVVRAMTILIEDKFNNFNLKETLNFIEKDFSWISVVKKMSKIMDF